jgi:hypothetical protein
MHRSATVTTVAAVLLVLGAVGASAQPPAGEAGSGRFQFTPLLASSLCTPGGDPEQPFLLPPGYTQEVLAQEGDGGTTDLWGMNTQNETALSKIPEVLAAAGSTGGPHVGRFLYRTHETGSGGHVSVTDLGAASPTSRPGEGSPGCSPSVRTGSGSTASCGPRGAPFWPLRKSLVRCCLIWRCLRPGRAGV